MVEPLDDSTWVGTSPGGDKFYEMRFNKGGVFTGSFYGGMSLMASGNKKLEGSWSQAGSSVNVVLSGILKGQEFKATRSGNSIKGTWAVTYSFEVTRVIAKPLATTEEDEAVRCNLRGTKVTVFYRDKAGVNLGPLAASVAEKLRSTGAEVQVQKGNLKEQSEKVVFYNGQSQIAATIAECVNSVTPISPSDGGVSYLLPNVFQIYLQTPGAAIAKSRDCAR